MKKNWFMSGPRKKKPTWILHPFLLPENHTNGPELGRFSNRRSCCFNGKESSEASKMR